MVLPPIPLDLGGYSGFSHLELTTAYQIASVSVGSSLGTRELFTRLDTGQA
jgi:hypothetical protein